MTERINLLGLEQEALRYKHVHMQSCPVDPDVLLALISELTELRALRSERSWIRCSERMPEIGQSVFFVANGETHAGDYDGYWNEADGYWTLGRVTHWMPCFVEPLPTPPGDE